MSRILLLLDHKENRRLLAEALSRHDEVVSADSDAALDLPFDMGVLDGPALDRLWQRVAARKKREPEFLPVLLVTARPDIGLVTRHMWESVDELILSPIERVELQARVVTLLRARHFSVMLGQRVEERTAALATANQELRHSRLVALNLMEDACAARARTEQANTALQREVTERQQAETALRQVTRLLQEAQDEERRRLARELHDSTAQKLAATTMNLCALEAALGETAAGRRPTSNARSAAKPPPDGRRSNWPAPSNRT